MILELESIQRQCHWYATLQLAVGINEFNYLSLGERRIRGDLIETFNIVNGKVD